MSADAVQLKTVFNEILSNAEEAIPSAGKIEIEIDTDCGNQEGVLHDTNHSSKAFMCIKVHDTGAGMDEEILQHIFEPFYSNKFTGRGLGMAAAFGIVKNHGGTIRVESTPGRGTGVFVFLPVREESSDMQKISPQV